MCVRQVLLMPFANKETEGECDSADLPLGPTALPRAVGMPRSLPFFDTADNPMGHLLWESPYLQPGWGWEC